MSEEWRPVPGWEYYEVSSLGRVRSLDKITPARGGGVQKKQGKVLRQQPVQGYLRVTVQGAGHRRTLKVHVLVLEAFVGPKPDVGQECRHLNGDSTDNRADNLMWGTRSENVLDQVFHGTHSMANKMTCPRGHPYDYIAPKSGQRACTTCRADATRRYRKKVDNG